MRYWECECCGFLAVTEPQDDAGTYKCEQCALSECQHGKFIEIKKEDFKKKAEL